MDDPVSGSHYSAELRSGIAIDGSVFSSYKKERALSLKLLRHQHMLVSLVLFMNDDSGFFVFQEV